MPNGVIRIIENGAKCAGKVSEEKDGLHIPKK